MISDKTTLFPFLHQSENTMFFQKPKKIAYDENAFIRYASSQKIETLIDEMKEKGPMVAFGQFGPQSYETAPFPLQNAYCHQKLFGWKPGSGRRPIENRSIIVLGAKKLKERECIYFTPSDEAGWNPATNLMEHGLSSTDKKVYVISYRNFQQSLSELYPPYRENRSPADYRSTLSCSYPSLSSFEEIYVRKLTAITPLEAILDESEGERACKTLGQEIFDYYKRESGGSSLSGKLAVQRICETVALTAKDGPLRKQFIERAWDRIGDENWKWIP